VTNFHKPSFFLRFLIDWSSRIRNRSSGIPFLEYICIFLFGLCIQISSWRNDFEGGDIAAARRSFLSDSPIDIWGGFSGLFYAAIPNQVLSWGICLAILQLINTSIGLVLVRKSYLRNLVGVRRVFFIAITYIILNFVSSLTRDSTMFSFILLGFGILIKSHVTRKRSQKLFFQFCGYFSLVIGCSFRPWISIAVFFLLFGISKNLNLKLSRTKQIALFLMITLAPIGLDNLSYLVSNLRQVHPELQVIAMDAGTLACYSNNTNTRNEGVGILNRLGAVDRDISQICGDFHPNTWESVAYWKLSDKDRSGLGLSSSSAVYSDRLISISTEMERSNYEEVRRLWISAIRDNPKDYIQIKISQFVQVIGAGDTFGLRLLEFNQGISSFEVIKALILLPYDVVISLHFLAPITAYVLGIIFLLYSYRDKPIRHIYGRLDLGMLFTFLFTWSAMSTIAFIGDNGRYVYSSSLLFVIFILSFTEKDTPQSKHNNNFVGG
jgi:hypothetical protein